MAATVTRNKLPISDAQAEAVIAVVEAVCREFGVVAEIVVKPTLDPELPPYRMALVEAHVPESVPDEMLWKIVSAVFRALDSRGLSWPAIPLQALVW